MLVLLAAIVVCVVVAGKLAAVNLLPLPMLNGGQAIGLLARGMGAKMSWPAPLTIASVLAWLAAWSHFASRH